MKRYLTLLIPLCFISHIAYADMSSANKALKAGDFAKAVEEFTKLAEQGDVKAQSHLGYMYYVGEGVEQNYAEAVKWYRKAAAQGDKDAQYNLAVSYAFGEGIKQNYKEAAIWYRRAAEQGHAIAQYSLGISYAYGEGVEQDEKQAAEWFLKSAEQGYERAQVLLGSMFHTGDGIPKNYDKAVFWYRKAADRGNAAAQYNLGTLYRAGKGVPQDYNQAIRWFRQSADQGYAAAQNELESMERAIAGATREVSRPDTGGEPDKEIAATTSQQPEPIKKSEAPVEETTTSESKLVTQEKDALLNIDSPADKTQEKSDQDTTTVVTQAEVITEEEPQTAPTEKPEEDKPGFFSRLFGTGETKDEEAQAKEEAISTAYKDLATTQQPDQEAETSQESKAPEESTSQDTQTRSGTPSNAITNLWARPLIKQPDIEETKETIAAEKEEKQKQEVAIKDIETPYQALEKPEPVTETPKEETVVKKEPIEIKEIETPYQPIPAAPIVKEEEPDTTAKTENKIETEKESKKGFFSSLFSSNDDDEKTAQVSESTDEEKITEDEPKPVAKKQVAIKDIETPYQPIETPPQVEEKVAEKTEIVQEVKNEPEEPVTIKEIETPYVALPEEQDSGDSVVVTGEVTEEKPEGGGVFGFFSKLFSGDKKQDKESLAISDEVSEGEIASAETESVSEEPPPLAVEEPVVKSYAAGEAPAEQQLSTVKEDTVAMLDEESQTLPENLDTSRWDEQLMEPEEKSEEEIKTEPLSDSNVTEGENTEDLFGRFGDFFQGDQNEQVSEQTNSTPETKTPAKEEPVVQAMVETETEPSLDEQVEEVIEEDIQPETDTEISDISFENLQSLAVKGDTDAQYELAKSYYAGTGTKQNYSQAFLWYRRAAQQGNSEAQYSLGNMYLMGEGINQNDEEAMNWYAMAAEQGHEAAQHNLENLQRAGTTATEDPETAEISESEPEEEKGFFGRLFSPDDKEDGEAKQAATETTTEPSNEEATVEEETPQSTAESDYKLGVAYSYGEGVVKNHEVAFQYFQKSANLGYAPAQYKLGVAYAYGEGVEKDLEKATEWYKKSAEQGYTIAQRSLGNMYTNGVGIEQNKPLGLAWYSILAEHGNVMDVHRRDALMKELSELEIEEAERLKQQLSSNIKTDNSSS